MRLDPFPRFPALKEQMERKLTELFRSTARAVNGILEGSERLDSAKVGSSTDYTEFEADGTMVAKGAATCWDDLFVPLTTTRVGALNKPDFDYTNGGFLFPQNDETEILHFVVQFPHRWAGTDVYPHVHYQRTTAGKPTFVLKYAWFSIDGATAAPGTTIELGTEVMTYSAGSIHQINKSTAAISATGKGISSIMVCQLYRKTGDGVTGDVLTYQFDFHIEIDTLGSRSEYQK
jgi:hypothetical protein